MAKLNSTKIILGSFFIAVIIGTLLLSLPFASKDGNSTDFLSCLFTATSSLCVTGLVVVDTATHWSFFGQLIILILIQVGGLGVIVVTSLIAIFLGQKISFWQRTTLQEALSVQKVGGIIKLVMFVIRLVIIFELSGAFLLFFQFVKDFDLPTAIWYSFFHSISAFCNAGFDLMGAREPFSSLTFYQSNTLVNVVVMFLIVFGGIGFSVWDDIITRRFHFRKYKLQSKIVFFTTLFLILLPAIYFYFYEFQTLPTKTRVLSSLFQSVTTRTAGFNTADFNDMTDVGKSISMMLMLIGGSPGSTAGGMKTTTIAILIISTISVFKRQNEPHIFNRRIGMQIIKNAMTIFMMYLNMFLIFAFLICNLCGFELMDTLFETASALGTVGLTLGITTKLSSLSMVFIIILMFLGRVGALTFIYAIIPSLNSEPGYISENVAVG
ncbi:MAG: Trk family potassium uptake protein [Lachnospiraceae bacterium]|nr:Trk family potassium uptake protein [Lachnospiraceae bacterium]